MKFTETNIMIGVIKNHIKEENEKTRKQRTNYFYASDGYLPSTPDDSKCARNLAYQFLGYEEEVREDMLPVFVLGDLMHNKIQGIFVKEKLALQIEDNTILYDDDGKSHWVRQNKNKVIIDDPPIHGRKDIVFEIDSMKYIADIKSVGEWAWKYLNNKPKEPHYAQMQLYLHHDKLRYGFILYVNKSSGAMKEFMIEYDEEYAKKVLEDYKTLYAHIKTSKILPARCFPSGDEAPWQCRYCGFTKHCLGLTQKELEEKRFVVYPGD